MTFIGNVLDDLKEVSDRVERSRIVIAAHRSAKTYGDEMRALIGSRVQLKNVVRAVENQTDLIPDTRRTLTRCVRLMDGYLGLLITSFEKIYFDSSLQQSAYEADKRRMLEKSLSLRGLEDLENRAWDTIRKMLHEEGFLKLLDDDKPFSETTYNRLFEKPLDMATLLLRSELSASWEPSESREPRSQTRPKLEAAEKELETLEKELKALKEERTDETSS